MILWSFKLIKTVRRAIAGRKYPHQLAWAMAFGLLLGIVPHGNLLAVGLLIVVLSLQINHAMAALTAVAASFAATHLDPYSHQVGDYLLGHPEVAPWATAAWQLPVVPWTDLNNTVVVGSLTIGVVCLIPTFLMTYPVFRLFAPAKQDEEEANSAEASEAKAVDEIPVATSEAKSATLSRPNTHQVVLIDRRHQQVSPPQRSVSTTTQSHVSAAGKLQAADRHAAIDEAVKFTEIDAPSIATTASERTDVAVNHPAADDTVVSQDCTPRSAGKPKRLQAIETRIDVIRMKDNRSGDGTGETTATSPSADNEPMDEALNYLLRQLRDSQQRKAA